MKQNGHSLVVLSSFVMAMLTGAGNVLAACTGTGNICYVKLTPEGSQDCSSWANACGLQTALGQSASGDEIWVQKTGISVVGGYKPAVYDPTVLDGNRSVRFNLKAGVAMYGGFLGTEMERDERDWQSNGTQLSGNIGGGVNSHHVVWAFDANGAILDGFTIRAGDATNQTSTWQGGAGMVIYRDNPTIRNVTFTANKAYQGGAMLSLHSNPTLINVTFLGNTATVNPYSTSWGEKGGGMHIIGGNPTLINVTFRGNTADGYGGGLYNNGGSPTLTNVTFSNNSAPNGGSGLYNYDSNSLTLINTIIANGSGGGDCVNDSGASLNASSKNNLIEDSGSDACWLVDSSNGNIIGSDPNLGPLTHNSNNTAWWFPLLTGSPAIDAGTSEGAPATDQRGVSRPQGIAYDIGAYEYEAFAIVVNGAGANGGTMVAASGGSGIDATWNGTVTGGAKSSASVEPSSSHAITATANAGGFVAWSGDCDGTTGNGTDAATCTFTSVSSNKTATANFTLNSYAINDSANPAAGGSTTCTPNPVDHGGNSSCTYTANAGYTFTAWSGDCTGATCDLSNVTSAKTVTANFTLNSYAINDSANPAAGGSTTCTPDPVNHGGNSICTYTANAGYTFTAWSGDCTGATCDLSNVTTTKTATANFTLNSYAINDSANPAAGGSTTCTPDPVNHGGNSICTYTANAGYTFTAWSGDCTGATCDLSNVTTTKTVTANFTLNSYAINDSANPAAGGSTTCTPNPVGHGASSTCAATPNSGYSFSNWSGDCTGATCTLTNVTAAKSVTAHFTLLGTKSYTGASATGSGSITASFTGGGAGCGYTVSRYIAVSVVPVAPPAGVNFPHGLFDFTAGSCTPGSTLSFTITYPQALGPNTQYWKFGPTPDNAAPHWYVLPATIAGNTASFSITDGGLGDDDLAVNGTIVDQGGPGGSELAAVPTLSRGALVVLVFLLFALGGMARGRRR